MRTAGSLSNSRGNAKFFYFTCKIIAETTLLAELSVLAPEGKKYFLLGFAHPAHKPLLNSSIYLFCSTCCMYFFFLPVSKFFMVPKHQNNIYWQHIAS